MNKKFLTMTAILMLWSLFTIAQDEEAKSGRRQIRKARPYYIGFGVGMNRTSFRDFGTSPLIYRGNGVSFALSAIRFDDLKETLSELQVSTGSYSVIIGETFSSSSATSFFYHYQQLFKIKKISNEKWNFKAGGNLAWTMNFRQNPRLQNNSGGIEMVATAFLSGKVTRDLSRKEEKKKKILFIKYTLKPIERNLSYQLNLGLFNSNYRNGYVYLGQDALIDEPSSFSDYQVNIFSGLRMSSALNYTVKMNTGNLVMFSYEWDAYRTGKEFDKFELGQHTFKLSLWLKTK